MSRFFHLLKLLLCYLILIPGLLQSATAQEPGEQIGPSSSGVVSYAPARISNSEGSTIFGSVTLGASLTKDGELLSDGIAWRIFRSQRGIDGKLPLVASAFGGQTRFELEPGAYLVHAAYGRAGAIKRIRIGTEETNEMLVFDAGGLMLDAVMTGDVAIPSEELRFSIYKADSGPKKDSERILVLPDVPPKRIIRLNSGTYHVVSTFGSTNAIVRADIVVEPGKTTEAIVEHRAAQIILKLVSEAGGEAIADTAWAVLTESGDVVRENVGAYTNLVLAEGSYTAIARHKGEIFRKNFKVESGKNRSVELLAQL